MCRPILLACLLIASLPAQGARLLGWAASPQPAAGSLLTQDPSSCPPRQRRCSGILRSNPPLYGGATAYDPRHESVWVSDGQALLEIDPASCKTLCAPKPSIMRAGAVFSGLAVANKRGVLYHLETMPGYLGILPWNNRVCPPVPTKGGCLLQLPNNAYAGGLAYDEVRDLLYYTVTTPGPSTPTNQLHVAAPTSGCRPICTINLPICTIPGRQLGAVTGLAFDPCTDTLYVTDGRKKLSLRVDPVKCTVRLLGCCTTVTTEWWFGLGLIPAPSRTSVGRSCVSKACPFCPGLVTRTFGGVPALGNPDFGIEVADGPTGSLATLAIGLGDCTAGAPFLCGQFYLPTSTALLLVPLGTLGGSQCAATARLRAPIPVDPKLCGIRLCCQSLAVCAGSGQALSQALQLRLR